MPETPKWWNVGVIGAVAIIVVALVVAVLGALAVAYLIHVLGPPMDN